MHRFSSRSPTLVSDSSILISTTMHDISDRSDHSKEVLRYTREDGVELNATLYLPPNYDRQRDGPLPCILASGGECMT